MNRESQIAAHSKYNDRIQTGMEVAFHEFYDSGGSNEEEHKMVKATTTAKTRQTTKPRKAKVGQDKVQAKSTQNAATHRNVGAPIEHFHGEPTDKSTGDAGDLEEEVLDRHAPYNKTYGLKDGPEE